MAETTNKQILKPFYTEYASDPTGWTSPINGNWDIIDSAFGGTHPVTLSSSNVTLTDTECQNLKIRLSGSIGASNLTVFFPIGISGLFVVENLTSGTGTVSLASAGGGGLPRTAVRGANTLIWLDAATNSVTLADNSPVEGGVGITVDGTSIELDVPVTVPNGGTGQTSYLPGQLLIGNNAGGLSRATLTEGANIGIVSGNGTITISASGTVAGVNTFSAGSTGFGPNAPSAGAVLLTGVLNAASGGTGASTLTGYVKGTGVGVMTASSTIPPADISLASSRLLGRYSSGTGGAEEVAIGSGLNIVAGSLVSTATGTVTSVSGAVAASANGFSLTGSGTTAATVTLGVSNVSSAQTSLGLGTMATQAASAVAITGGSAVNLSAARVGTSTALTTAERVSVFAPASTNGVVSKVTTNGNYNFMGVSSSGTINFAVDGIGAVAAGDTASFTGAQARFTRSNEWALEAYHSAAGLSGTGAAAVCVNFAGNPLVGFYFNGTVSPTPPVGSISTNGTGVTYGTASDYRLKENVVNFLDGTSIVKNLRPVNFTWKRSPSSGSVNGFIAHEVQALVPQAVVGEKDAMNADGSMRPQTIDHSMLVPVLTATIKELIARVEALEAR